MPKVYTHRALTLGLIFAAMGFSYSLATNKAKVKPRVVLISGGGIVGQDNGELRFTNPKLNNPNAPHHLPPVNTNHPSGHADAVNFPNGGDDEADPDGFDLGDAEYTFNVPPGNPREYYIDRLITATGGVPPYSYTAPSLPLPGATATTPPCPSPPLPHQPNEERQTGAQEVLSARWRAPVERWS